MARVSELGGRISAIRAAVSPAMCREIVVEMLRSGWRPGTVLRKGVDLVDPELRLCHQIPLPPSPPTELVRQAFLMAGLQCSRGESEDWLLDGPLYNRYPINGRFRTHTDVSSDAADPPHVRNRRLTLVCFLNDDGKDGATPRCEGGALVIYGRGAAGLEPHLFLPEAGTVVAFDAALMHEVRPVIRGERLTAVAWLYSKGEMRNGRL